MKLLKNNFGIIIVVLLGLIPLVPLLHPGLPITHDGQDHVARIANFYQGLQDGILFPRWAANLNWGFGHPILMFLYPFPSYLASLFHVIGFDFVNSVKLVFALSFITSGIFMYLWMRNQFDEYSGVAASVLYMYAPYHFVDFYVRGAIGEFVAFVFLPLCLYFIFKCFNNKKDTAFYPVMLSVSVCLLLLSHNALSIMFLPFIIFYILFLSYISRDYQKTIKVFLFFVLGILLSSFFLLPAFFEGKYTLRDIVTGNEYANNFINPINLLYSPWSYGGTGQFSIRLGLVQILGVILLPLTVVKLRYEKKAKDIQVFLIFTFIFLLLSIFLQLSISNFVYQIFTTLKKFQFPWRFMSLTIFATAVIASSVFLTIKNEKYKKTILLIIIVFVSVISISFWQPKGYLIKSETFYTGIYKSTTDTGESSPIWSTRFMEKIPKANMEVISGKARVRETYRNTVLHKYNVNVLSDSARLKDNTVYFPGWEVLVDGKKIKDIQFQDPQQRGLITFYVPKGEHNIEVVFKDTKFRIFSDVVSAISVLVLLVFIIFESFKVKIMHKKR